VDPKKAEEEKKKAEEEKKKAEEEAKKLAEEQKKKAEEEKKKREEDAKKAAEELKKAEATPLPAAPIETLRKDRPDRRKVAVDRLRRRWGSLIADAKAAEDLKLHARRVAHLQRIRAVATAKKDKKTVETVDELLTKEDERHAKTMNSLREGALPGTP
jgi:membrane protein involved in colicin uptake